MARRSRRSKGGRGSQGAANQDLERAMATITGNIRKQVTEALNDLGQMIKEDSQELCPVDTGALRESAFHLVRPGKKRSELILVVGYAKGGQPDYAVKVHEDTSVYHNPGQAKFLSTVMNYYEPQIEKMIADAVRIKRTGSKK